MECEIKFEEKNTFDERTTIVFETPTKTTSLSSEVHKTPKSPFQQKIEEVASEATSSLSLAFLNHIKIDFKRLESKHASIAELIHLRSQPIFQAEFIKE